MIAAPTGPLARTLSPGDVVRWRPDHRETGRVRYMDYATDRVTVAWGRDGFRIHSVPADQVDRWHVNAAGAGWIGPDGREVTE